jgi:hypothetical protein
MTPDAALQRMGRIALGLGLAGILAAGILRGMPAAAGFAIGAGMSVVNFLWWKRLADDVGAPGKEPPRAAVILGLRYLLLGALVYAAIAWLGVNPAWLLGGLLTAAAAVLAGLVLELFRR